MNIIVSVSLRSDEYTKLEEKMKELGLNRHQVLKLAIRRFFFPDEREIIVDGKFLTPHQYTLYSERVEHPVFFPCTGKKKVVDDIDGEDQK